MEILRIEGKEVVKNWFFEIYFVFKKDIFLVGELDINMINKKIIDIL